MLPGTFHFNAPPFLYFGLGIANPGVIINTFEKENNTRKKNNLP